MAESSAEQTPAEEQKPQTSPQPKKRKPLVSPSSSFVDFSTLTKEIYNEDDKIDNNYDPYANRKVRKPLNDFETVVHLVKGCIGAGILAMPRAFYDGGVGIGVIGTPLLGLLCGYGIHVMLRMKYLQCKWLGVPFLALPRALKIAFLNGPPPFPKLACLAPFIADFFLATNQIGLCATYITFIAHSFKEIMEPDIFKDLDIRIYMVIMFFPMLLLNYIRNLKRLAFVSLTADLLIAAALTLCFYYIFIIGPWAVDTPGQVRMVAPLKTFPFFVTITIFALDAVGVMITLEHNMKTPAHFLGYRGLFPWSMVLITTLYLTVGLSTYLKYGEKTGATIVASLPTDEWISTACRAMVALAIFGSYPLQLFVGLEIIWGNYLTHYIKNRDIEYIVEYAMRTVVVFFTFAMAVAIPQIDLVISLVGSFCLSILSLVIPFVFELCTRYPHDYGLCKYVMIKDIFLIFIGLCILVFGTAISVQAIIEHNT